MLASLAQPPRARAGNNKTLEHLSHGNDFAYGSLTNLSLRYPRLLCRAYSAYGGNRPLPATHVSKDLILGSVGELHSPGLRGALLALLVCSSVLRKRWAPCLDSPDVLGLSDPRDHKNLHEVFQHLRIQQTEHHGLSLQVPSNNPFPNQQFQSLTLLWRRSCTKPVLVM